MDINEMINSSMKNRPPILSGNNLFALEGNIPNNRYRILPLKEVYINTIACFQYSIEANNVILGIFNCEEAATDFITMVQALYRNEHGNTIQ